MFPLTKNWSLLLYFVCTDAVTVVLYHLFESLSQFDEITYAEVIFKLYEIFMIVFSINKQFNYPRQFPLTRDHEGLA